MSSYTTEVGSVNVRAYERNLYQQARAIGVGVRDHLQQTGEFPTSLAALGALPGYEYVDGLVDENVGYALVTGLQGSEWEYDRAVVFVQDPINALNDADYLLNNTCGTDVTDSSGFCGDENSWYVVLETRQQQMGLFTEVGLALEDTSYRLARAFDGSMPTTRDDGTELASGDSDLLADIVGYLGTVNGCTGAFMFEEAVLTCGDLFSPEGTPVGYFFVSATEAYVGVAVDGLVQSTTGDPEFIFRGFNIE